MQAVSTTAVATRVVVNSILHSSWEVLFGYFHVIPKFTLDGRSISFLPTTDLWSTSLGGHLVPQARSLLWPSSSSSTMSPSFPRDSAWRGGGKGPSSPAWRAASMSHPGAPWHRRFRCFGVATRGDAQRSAGPDPPLRARQPRARYKPRGPSRSRSGVSCRSARSALRMGTFAFRGQPSRPFTCRRAGRRAEGQRAGTRQVYTCRDFRDGISDL